MFAHFWTLHMNMFVLFWILYMGMFILFWIGTTVGIRVPKPLPDDTRHLWQRNGE